MNAKKLAQQARTILDDPNATQADYARILTSLVDGVKTAEPWWVIVLKTLAYLIGLLLAGIGTSAAAQTLLF